MAAGWIQKIPEKRNAKRKPRTLRLCSDIFHPKIMEQIDHAYDRLRLVNEYGGVLLTMTGKVGLGVPNNIELVDPLSSRNWTFQIAVRTVFRFHVTSRGRPTFTESNLCIPTLSKSGSEKNPCCTTKLNSRFAIGTFLWLKADTRERELPSRIPHAQSTFRRVPINLRRTERAASVVPQFVGESCNLFVRVFFLHVFLLVGCQARVNGAAYQPSNLPASQ